MFTIIIILIVLLVVMAIVINGWQQHRAKQEAERRTELAKFRAIVDETENVIMACANMPVSPRLMQILHTRVLGALKAQAELGAGSADIKQRIADAENSHSNAAAADPNPQGEFSLPDNDKLIIQYIQGVKKLRVLLRSEHSKGKIDARTFAEEDKNLERLQLKVNVETLVKRGRSALQSNMLGSARQYFEKAITALDNQTQPDDYILSRASTLKEWLKTIQDDLKNANAEDRARRQEEERDELDELFAPKKKW
ncbi:hypothetical protein [Aestuariibacter sp. A3R04]|uniref:hypothetical protein n=1 Tax=Aestuariibacter sp. A3R04 TaxID=2841571 RepID=UPI001C0A0785|nr:hypothetical protein [Aestuariibacter sp. A3R04]MBU3022935.1 hypothetical protein [Aestuariibacter sp. A3R04]